MTSVAGCRTFVAGALLGFIVTIAQIVEVLNLWPRGILLMMEIYLAAVYAPGVTDRSRRRLLDSDAT